MAYSRASQSHLRFSGVHDHLPAHLKGNEHNTEEEQALSPF